MEVEDLLMAGLQALLMRTRRLLEEAQAKNGKILELVKDARLKSFHQRRGLG